MVAWLGPQTASKHAHNVFPSLYRDYHEHLEIKEGKFECIMNECVHSTYTHPAVEAMS